MYERIDHSDGPFLELRIQEDITDAVSGPFLYYLLSLWFCLRSCIAMHPNQAPVEFSCGFRPRSGFFCGCGRWHQDSATCINTCPISGKINVSQAKRQALRLPGRQNTRVRPMMPAVALESRAAEPICE